MTVASPAHAADITTSSSDHAGRDDHQQQQQQQSPEAPISSESELHIEGILFVIGDALLDVCANVSRKFIESHHLQFGQAIVATELHKGHLTPSR